VGTQLSISLMIVSRDRLFADALTVSLSACERLHVQREQPEDRGPWPTVDVILIDAAWHPERALARFPSLRERLPASKLVVLGLAKEDERMVDFIEAGADGYVLQESSATRLAEAILSIHAGTLPCSSRIASLVLDRILKLSRGRGPDHEVEPLTGREREVLQLIARRLGNKEIARQLGISNQTAKNHVHNILEKLGVHSRREAIRVALERGVLAALPMGGAPASPGPGLG
jgi:DNA-binding NarL/FixJ family response regulator